MREWSTLRRLMYLKGATGAPPVEATATGNPLVFTTDLARPLKSLLIPFTPIQSGTGDPSPENIRPIVGYTGCDIGHSGLNVFPMLFQTKTTGGITYTDNGDGSLTLDGTCTSFKPQSVALPINLPAGTYRIRANNEKAGEGSGNIYLGVRDILNNDYGVGLKTVDATAIINATNPISKIFLNVFIGAKFDNVTIKPQLTPGTAVKEYSPYTGESYSVVFPAMGKNLLNPATLEQGGINMTGEPFSSTKRVRSGFIPIEAGKKYVCTASSGQKTFIHFFDANKGNVSQNEVGVVTAPANAVYARCIFGYDNEDDIAPNDVTQGQLEQSASATTYEPFTNTVYGGTLDVVSGVLTVDTVCETFTWGDVSGSSLASVTRKVFQLSHDTPNTSTKDGKYCDKAKFLNDYSSNTTHFYTAIVSRKSNAYIFLPNGTPDTETVQIAYPLATPQEIQLTPTQITALVGDNTIWSDANGQMTAVYLKKK